MLSVEEPLNARALSSFRVIAVNESFGCVLGVDTALRVAYSTDESTVHEPQRSFAERTKTTTCCATTTIANKHKDAITGLVVRDAIPRGDEDAGIGVTLRKPAGLAQTKDGEEVMVSQEEGGEHEIKARWTTADDGKGGEKNGMFEWVCGIAAGEKVQLKAVWDVKTPDALEWEEAN